MIDPVAGTITLPISLAAWGAALALFGLMMAGIAFVVATFSLFQRHNMHKETTRYVQLLMQANSYAAMLEAQKPTESIIRVDGAGLTEEQVSRMIFDSARQAQNVGVD